MTSRPPDPEIDRPLVSRPVHVVPRNDHFKFEYASAANLRSHRHEALVTYTDDQGVLSFVGIDPGHESGGMLYFPTCLEWVAALPERVGQRQRIFSRLLEYVRRQSGLAGFVLSLTEPGFFVRWPEQRALARKHWDKLIAKNSDPHPWDETRPTRRPAVPPPSSFEIRFVPAAELKGQPHECLIRYRDAVGELLFPGFDTSHPSGGLIYFPTEQDWDRACPWRQGQSYEIFGRVWAHVRCDETLLPFEPSLIDWGHAHKWTAELERLRAPWLQGAAASPVRSSHPSKRRVREPPPKVSPWLDTLRFHFYLMLIMAGFYLSLRACS